MADQTHSAVDSLLGLLSSAIKEEARLLGGVQGDIQFIKDEMDSMNGFLLHLTKTETEHNDQHRAWMKQVRDIAYIAQDCIELYMRDLSPPGTGFWAFVRHLPVLLRTAPARHRLAVKIHELKDRVREVGERRLRYGVSVPDARPKPEPVRKDSTADEKREEFIRALEKESTAAAGAPSPSFNKAISLLPGGLDLPSKEVEDIHGILKKRVPAHVDSMMKMLLRALYAHPPGTKEELENLKNKLEGRADVRKEVMVFCYSKLSTHYKSCLQYLTAFLVEDRISRTSLVRRWVAEGLVARDEEGTQTMEEAGERCFNDLVFQGFVRPATPVTGPKIKSCDMEKWVKEFVVGISKSENFVAAALPTHLRHQIRIRKIARRQPPQQPQQRPRSWNICPRKQQPDNDDTVAEDKQHPMDQMARLLKTLPEEYRLNVLDLGGCSALKDHHLKSVICKVLSLKYLSLKNTGVSRLPTEINNLRRLETLDVRDTQILDTTHIVLTQLKHLLAGSYFHDHETESPVAVKMSRKIASFARSMEILRYVQIFNGNSELEPVGHLKQLRKLGVVLDGSEDNIKHLLRTINKLSERLRSLSVWITGSGFTLDDKEGTGAIFSPPKNLESLNMSISCGSLPRWIEGLKLLSKITLRDTQLSPNSLRTLGRLESLCCLRLRRGSYTDASINLENGEFPKLRFLLIHQVTHTIKIAFQAHAAPKLEKIAWTVDWPMEITAGTISGTNNLPNLEEIRLSGNWSDPGQYLKQTFNVAISESTPSQVVLVPKLSSSFDSTLAHEVSITEQ